jgi:zinc protease
VKRARARWPALAALLAALLAASPGRGQDRAPAVVEATLDNGLRVLVLEDRRVPVVAVQVWYRVGSRDERVGKTGLSHFLEHMMFKGTPRVGPREYARRVEAEGGEHNAFTTRDVTAYHVDVAADRVGLVLELEADRMAHLLLAADEIAAERKVILEERRTRTEDDPLGDLAEAFNLAAFTAHPYRLPVIGFAQDIRGLAVEDLRAWYRTYYVPANALLVVVGDVQAGAVLDRVRELFGPLPPGPAPPRVGVIEPEPRGPRRVEVWRDARLPVVLTGYPAPVLGDPDAPALDVLATVLAGGRSARLHRRLVQEARVALDVGGDYSPLGLEPGLLTLYATALPGKSAGELEAALRAEVERLRTGLVEEDELARAQNQIEAGFVFGQDSAHARAATLARYELAGGWRLEQRYLPAIRAVTREDVRRAAERHLVDARRTTAVLVPTPASR